MSWKEIKFYARLYWIRILIAIAVSIIFVLLNIVIINGLRAWRESESYLRQSQLATAPLQMFIWGVMGLIQGTVYVFMMYWMFYKRGMSSFTQTTKKSIAGETIGITWNDVIGMNEAKQEALEVVRLVKDRAELQRIGGKILRGILLLGPPGCGKTYLAKAIATEAGLPFISMSGSEFVEMFVGVGAGRIRNLFRQARQLAELKGGSIIFIDEIDAVGAQRVADVGFGGQTETNTTLNQLLVEMDGLKQKDLNIVIIGATNMPEYFLDAALLRPGRFDRKIYVDKPSLEDREKLFAYYLKDTKYDNNVRIDRLARIAVGNSPADIANIVRESALIAVRNKRQLITMKDIDEARERIALGIKRRIKISEKEKWQIAYHEAGHAIVTYLLVASKDVFKITIAPRGHTGGATWVPEREEMLIQDQQQLLNEIRISLGAYAAEKIKLGYTTAGVGGDFSTALYTAHNMVWRMGMGKSGIIGDFHALDFFRRVGGTPLISEEIKAKLDNDVQDIMQGCLREVTQLLKDEEPLLDRLAKELVTKDELNYDEIESIFKEFGKSRPAV